MQRLRRLRSARLLQRIAAAPRSDDASRTFDHGHDAGDVPVRELRIEHQVGGTCRHGEVAKSNRPRCDRALLVGRFPRSVQRLLRCCSPWSSALWPARSRPPGVARRTSCVVTIRRSHRALVSRWCPITATPAAVCDRTRVSGRYPLRSQRSSAISVPKRKQLADERSCAVDRIEHPAVVVAVLDAELLTEDRVPG